MAKPAFAAIIKSGCGQLSFLEEKKIRQDLLLLLCQRNLYSS